MNDDTLAQTDETTADATAETVETTEATETGNATDTGRRGRPRPTDTIQRDETVLALIPEEGGVSRDELVKALTESGNEMPSSKVYLSLHRLRRDGKVTRARIGSAHKWVRGSDANAADTTGTESDIAAEAEASATA